MKLRSLAFVLVLLPALAQQECAVMEDGKISVSRTIDAKVMPEVRQVFPKATWVMNGSAVFVETGVRGVSLEFVNQLSKTFGPKIAAQVNQKKNTLEGLFGQIIGVFPSQFSFTFNTPECGDHSDTSVAMTYYTSTSRLSVERWPNQNACLEMPQKPIAAPPPTPYQLFPPPPPVERNVPTESEIIKNCLEQDDGCLVRVLKKLNQIPAGCFLTESCLLTWERKAKEVDWHKH